MRLAKSAIAGRLHTPNDVNKKHEFITTATTATLPVQVNVVDLYVVEEVDDAC